MSKTCLECGDKIIGREDKKFCSDGCRNAYNNKMNKDQNNLMRNINNKLRKNYRILCELNPEEKGKTTKIIMVVFVLAMLKVFTKSPYLQNRLRYLDNLFP